MSEYSEIKKANEEIKTIQFKGNSYAEVKERVNAFRKVYPSGFIITEIISNDGNLCVIRASCGFYENGEPKTIACGTAFELKTSSYVNKTSYVENCETSAVGRCLGFAGFGIDSAICSADEMMQKDDPMFQEAPKRGEEAPPAAPTPGDEKAPKMSREEMLATVDRLYTEQQKVTLAKTRGIASYTDMTDDELAALIERLRKAGKIK